MEPAIIDWKRVDSRYVPDEAYENINAPMWLDLASPNDIPVDDIAWFCRPDCNHPKTAEDFKLSVTPSPKAKLMRSSSERLPFGERNSNRRDENNLKRRVGAVAAPLLPASPVKPKTAASKISKVDLENQDPNQSTPSRPTRSPKTRNPRLKSTMSARNLFSGKDVLSQISEFYHELKRMAVGSRTPPVGVEAKDVKKAAENLIIKNSAARTIDLRRKGGNRRLRSKNRHSVKKSEQILRRHSVSLHLAVQRTQRQLLTEDPLPTSLLNQLLWEGQFLKTEKRRKHY